MSLIPEFELGLWNAWILVIPMLIIFFFDVRATVARESGDFPLTKKEKRISNAIPLPIIVSFVYAVFFASTTWYNLAIRWSPYLSIWDYFDGGCSSELRFRS